MRNTAEYQHSVIYCDCLDCPYNDHDNDYTCRRKEVYLNQGDCIIATQLSKEEREAL